MICPRYFHNIFTLNSKWQGKVILVKGSNLNQWQLIIYNLLWKDCKNVVDIAPFTKYRWLVVIGFNLNLLLKLFFCRYTISLSFKGKIIFMHSCIFISLNTKCKRVNFWKIRVFIKEIYLYIFGYYNICQWSFSRILPPPPKKRTKNCLLHYRGKHLYVLHIFW